MTGTDAVAAVLYQAEDVDDAARKLLPLLVDQEPSDQEVRSRGFDPALVKIARRKIGEDIGSLLTACLAAVSREQGRRSVDRDDNWEPVITGSFEWASKSGVRRGTAETVVSLIRNAKTHAHLVAPFIESVGLGYLSRPLARATARGVQVRILAPADSRKDGVFGVLVGKVEKEGAPENLRIQPVAEDSPWPHLKVVASDADSAYVGSANLTRPALAGDNLELGVLVEGDAVSAIVNVLESIPLAE